MPALEDVPCSLMHDRKHSHLRSVCIFCTGRSHATAILVCNTRAQQCAGPCRMGLLKDADSLRYYIGGIQGSLELSCWLWSAGVYWVLPWSRQYSSQHQGKHKQDWCAPTSSSVRGNSPSAHAFLVPCLQHRVYHVRDQAQVNDCCGFQPDCCAFQQDATFSSPDARKSLKRHLVVIDLRRLERNGLCSTLTHGNRQVALQTQRITSDNSIRQYDCVKYCRKASSPDDLCCVLVAPCLISALPSAL